jgi:hypothetical protein
MSLPKVLIVLALVLFAVVGGAAFFKKKSSAQESEPVIALAIVEEEIVEGADMEAQELPIIDATLPEANRIEELFNKRDPRLPIVETITYKSYVSWKPGKPAWISDYASHYKTSRHFIARSLHGKADYEKQAIADGDRFNVFKEDKNFNFHLLVDILTSKMWFYYVDNDTNEKILIKTYDVGLGRIDPPSPSGTLTPLGTYQLGEKVGIYRPKMVQTHQGEKQEMVRIFGTRWIPFEKEIAGCTADAKGYGIHGLPWVENPNGELVEEIGTLRKYLSDGCIRLATEDMEELFSIIITKPTTIEIVRGFHTAGGNHG